MKKFSVVVAMTMLLIASTASAEIVKMSKFWTAVGTNTSTWIQSQSGSEAQVTIKANGVQDGTVTIYTCPAQDATTCMSVGTVAGGVSSATTYAGTSSAFLYVTLTGNTPATGSIDAYVVIKN
jgi:hypothetical protein